MDVYIFLQRSKAAWEEMQHRHELIKKQHGDNVPVDVLLKMMEELQEYRREWGKESDYHKQFFPEKRIS
ncbi:MAG: hypothetical protein QM731_10615 [Chitinophagaceae bacterium]